MATTWNPADKTASVTLSGGDLIATVANLATFQGVRATAPFGAKNYCETKVSNAANSLHALSTTGFSFATQTGGQCVFLLNGGGTVTLYDGNTFGVLGSFSGSIANNDVIGWALDGTTLYVTQNGTNRIGDASAGTGGATIPSGTYYASAIMDGTAGSNTATLQADTTTYSPPSGYSLIGGGGGGSTYTLTADKGTYTQTGVAADFPSLVSKAAYKSAANGTTTATMPTHAAGDLLLIFAYRDGNATAPSLPAGWTNILTQAGTTCSLRVGYKFAASSSETSGTWTNATELEVVSYSGVDRIGASASQAGTATSVTYPALTMAFGNSWVVAGAGHRSLNTTLESPPTGMTLRDNRLDATAETAVFDTNGLVTSFTSRSVAVGGTASGWTTASVELVPTFGGAPGSVSYSLTADKGTYTLTGIAAGLRSARKLLAAAGAYAMAGQAAGLRRGLKLIAAQGAYSLTGNAGGLRAARKLTAEPGSYVYTGISATLVYTPAVVAYTLTADAGAYVLTGQAAALRADRKLAASQGAYSLSGQAATLAYAPVSASYTLTAESGAYSVNGVAAGLVYAPAGRGLSGSGVKRYRRGRVGRLDEEYRRQLAEEQAARIAEQVRIIAERAEAAEAESPLPDYAKLADLQAQLGMLRVTMATVEFLQRRAAYQEQAEREAAEMQVAVMAYVEAMRIAEERDEEDAIEAFLLAA